MDYNIICLNSKTFFFAYDLDSFPPLPHSLATAHPSTYLNYPHVSQCLKYLSCCHGVVPYVESSKRERRQQEAQTHRGSELQVLGFPSIKLRLGSRRGAGRSMAI